MTPRPTALLRRLVPMAAAGWLCVAACDKAPAPVDTATSASSLVAPAPPPPSSPPPATSTAVPQEPLQLLAFQYTSRVDAKEPVDTVEAAEPGMRVYAHLKLRNRSEAPRVVHLVFRVNGESRTKVDLTVEPSWSYRTWAYNTLRKADKTGELELTVTEDSGAVLVDKALPIRAKAVKKPQRK